MVGVIQLFLAAEVEYEMGDDAHDMKPGLIVRNRKCGGVGQAKIAR